MRSRFSHILSSLTLLVAGLVLMCGCSKFRFKRKALGIPFKVLIANDIDNLADSALSVPSPGLPQYEPLADVETHQDSFEAEGKWNTIVNIRLDKRQKRPSMLKFSNENIERIDKPFIIDLSVKNKENLVKALQLLQNLVVKSEIIRAQKRLLQSHNSKAEKLILKMFGRRMLIPKDLTATKVGKDFLWLSNNSADKMINICLYQADAKHFIRERDSIMQANIPGETPGMYMQTDSVFRVESSRKGSIIIRGLWRMKGESMAGPFVAYLPTPPKKEGKRLVAEAFVYAPGIPKRNLLRQAEAALFTLNIRFDK